MDATYVLLGDWNWRRAVADSDLASTTKHVLLTLSLYASDAGEGVFPSVATLVRQTSLTRKTVKRHLRTAHDAGWIVRQPRHADNGRQKSNLYHLACPFGGGGNVVPPPEADAPGRGERSTPPIPLNGDNGNGVSAQASLLADAVAGAGADELNDRAERFEALWALCRRGSKKKAREQYMRKVPASVDADTVDRAWRLLLAGTRSVEYVPHLFRWLRDERWTEELPDAGAALEPGTPEWLRAEEARIGG